MSKKNKIHGRSDKNQAFRNSAGRAEKVSAQRISTKNQGLNIKPGVFLLGILVFTFLLYMKSWKGQILNWDDNIYILENKAIHKLDFTHLKEIFTSFYAVNYHPLTTLSWAIEYAMVGSKNVFLYHFTNILLHLLNTALVYRLFRLISFSTRVALLVALLHGIHPMHVESVAWISERKDVLYGFFFLFSLVMYASYLRRSQLALVDESEKEKTSKRGAWGLYSASFFLFLLSLFSKSAAVVLPVILLLIDLLLKRKFSLRMIVEKVPFFLLSLAFGLLALSSQKVAMGEHEQYSLVQMLLIVNHSIFRYFYMAFLPIGLSSFHPWPSLTNGSLPTIFYIAPIFNLAILSAVVFSIRKSIVPLFGLLFFGVCLSLVLQLVPVGSAVIADRYSYIPYLGLFFVFAAGIDALYKRNANSTFIRYTLTAVILLISSYYSYASIQRMNVWLSNENLWNDMISNYPESCHVGYMQRAIHRKEKNDIAGEYADLTKLIEMGSGEFSEALAMRGQIKSDSGNFTGAMNDYNMAISADSSNFLSFNNRAALKMKLNDLPGALFDIERSIRNKNDYYLSWFNRGAIKIGLKDNLNAVQDFDRSLALKPDYCEAYYGKAAALGNAGKRLEAIESYSRAIECRPNYLDAFLNRAEMKIQLNNFKDALSDLNEVIRFNPNYAIAYTKIGFVNFKIGDKAAACQAWQKGAALGDSFSADNLTNFCK